MYNVIENNDIYSKTSGSLQQYYRDEAALDDNDAITDVIANNNNNFRWFKFNEKITGKTGNDG